MSWSATRLALLAATLALGGCVSLEKGRQLEARVQRLEVQNAEQAQKLEELVRDRVAKMDQKIQEVQKKIDELNQAARRSGADLGVQLGRLSEEFTRVKGDQEASQHRLGELEKGLSALDSKTEGRFAALKGAGALDEYEAKQRIASLPKGEDKASLFALAQKEERTGDPGVARELYQEYVRRFPSDPKSADASFRAGEILFGQKRWREALLAYGKVAEGFPRSPLAANAMLGAAESMIKLEMKDEAKAVLEQLLEKYPKDEVAPRARERLAELSPPPPPPPPDKKKQAPKKK